jgi:hypothetical protein
MAQYYNKGMHAHWKMLWAASSMYSNEGGVTRGLFNVVDGKHHTICLLMRAEDNEIAQMNTTTSSRPAHEAAASSLVRGWVS